MEQKHDHYTLSLKRQKIFQHIYLQDKFLLGNPCLVLYTNTHTHMYEHIETVMNTQ